MRGAYKYTQIAMKKYSTYLFDLYGTLVDIHTDESSPAFWKKMADYFNKNGALFTPEELHSKYTGYALDESATLAASLQESTPGEERWPEIELDKVFYWLYSDKFEESAPINSSIPLATEATANTLDWRHDFVNAVTVTPELLHSTMQQFRKESITHLRAYSGAVELLRALRATGSRVILLSNAQRTFTEAEMKELGLWNEFDDIFISSDYCCCKPDTHFYEAPVRKYNLNPSECLMIGNDPVNDIWGAKKAGMDALYIHSALSPKSADPIKAAKDNGADYIISSMNLNKLRIMLTKQ